MSLVHPLPHAGIYTDLVGNTPLVEVRLDAGDPGVWCKLEFLNPSGSIKDRIASFILGNAWRSGELRRGSRVVEASSGSTSIAMALVSAQLGLEFIAVMPEGVSRERHTMIRSYGGKVVWSPKEEGIHGALVLARELAREQGAFLPRQFENPENAAAHRYGIAREIVRQVPGESVDALVSGVGTGGTLVGGYQGLRDHGCDAVAVVARPVVSSLGRGTFPSCFRDRECCSFSHRIPGVVENLSSLYDPGSFHRHMEVEVEDRVALETTRRLIRRGFPVGPSSGLNLAAAQEAARRLPEGAVIATVFADRMERYFSTELFAGLDENA